jgi:hypothetical protein
VESLKTPCDKVTRADLMKVTNFGKVFNEEAWCDVQNDKNYTLAVISFLARGINIFFSAVKSR